MLYQLKPLHYSNLDKHTIECKTPTHLYTIRYDHSEKSYRINYKEYATNFVGFCYEDSLAKAKEWIEKIHLPSKLKDFFTQTSKEEIDTEPTYLKQEYKVLNPIRPSKKMLDAGIEALKNQNTNNAMMTVRAVYLAMVKSNKQVSD